jgi:hypothetical protein
VSDALRERVMRLQRAVETTLLHPRMSFRSLAELAEECSKLLHLEISEDEVALAGQRVLIHWRGLANDIARRRLAVIEANWAKLHQGRG